MAEFYITKEMKEADASPHEIHNTSCASLPDVETMRYLGSFASKEAAHSKARALYDDVSYCSNCIEPAAS